MTVNPAYIDEREYDAFMSDLANFIKKKTEAKGVALTAFGIREYGGVSTPDADTPVKILWGEPEVHEKLLNFKYKIKQWHLPYINRFRVSLGSFFQPNTTCAERLFALLRSWAPRPEKQTALLDVW